MKVFFDVDGVLIDGWHARAERRRPWDTTIERDLGVRRDAFQAALFGRPFGAHRSVMHACVAGERDLKQALAEILPGIGYGGPVDAFVDYWFSKDSKVNQGVLDVVRRLGRHAQVELYLLTGQEHHRAAYLWNTLGFRNDFQDILYSAKLGCLKSTPKFFNRVNALLGIVQGDHPLLFDDTAAVVDLARRAGWDACVFDTVDDVLGHARLRPLLTG